MALAQPNAVRDYMLMLMAIVLPVTLLALIVCQPLNVLAAIKDSSSTTRPQHVFRDAQLDSTTIQETVFNVRRAVPDVMTVNLVPSVYQIPSLTLLKNVSLIVHQEPTKTS